MATSSPSLRHEEQPGRGSASDRSEVPREGSGIENGSNGDREDPGALSILSADVMQGSGPRAGASLRSKPRPAPRPQVADLVWWEQLGVRPSPQ